MGTAEQGNRRTDEQGTLNVEVPEQYFFNHELGEAGSRHRTHGRKPQNGIF